MSMDLKTPQEIKIMQQGGEISGGILREVLKKAKPGITTKDLENFAEQRILQAGALPSFKTVRGYKFATCITVNDQVVHGLPGTYVLKDGDVVGIDLGVLYQGYHTDTAWTIQVGKKTETVQKFLKTGEDALCEAIAVAKAGSYVGDISSTIQTIIEKAGYSPVRVLTGHGVGKKLHEPPQIPCFGDLGRGPKLSGNMTISIEIIYNMGRPDVVFNDDGWTIVTRDGSLSGLFEKTIAVTQDKPIILT